MNTRLASWALALCALSVAVGPSASGAEDEPAAAVEWPAATHSARPWTRWWWHGSAVDSENINRLLEEYQAAGLGGVEITCIYGVKGNEDHNLVFRSPEWVEAVQHTISKAHRLDMDVDMPSVSGWRTGGPDVPMSDADSKLVLEKAEVAAGQEFEKQFGKTTPQAMLAVAGDGKKLDLTDMLEGDSLRWRAPADSSWTVYTLGYKWAGDRVKRPGPGGAGLCINPFSKTAVSDYLTSYGKTLDQLPGLRAQTHDSFEYSGDWQPRFLAEFERRRGYRLQDRLPELAGDGPSNLVARVKHDYRETMSDLVLEDLTETWVDWAHEHGCLARNQAHGSPANILDVYAACDIPETESFGRLQGGDAKPMVMKFASSAANVAGRRLASSETGTWLDEHFTVTLAELKEVVDRQILVGINHVHYHGTAYSPKDAAWPGWVFYASTQVNPQNPIWRDLPALNIYITYCQSVLQASRPDNDVLLYWPLHDTWHCTDGLRMDIRVHNADDWLFGHPLGDTAELLEKNGYAFDFVSDRGLATCKADADGKIRAPGGTYRAVVIPRAQTMPIATVEKLTEFAEAGATVVFWRNLPRSEPGMKGAVQSFQWNRALGELRSALGKSGSYSFLSDLSSAGVRCEQGLKELDLGFLRKTWDGDTVYFLKNQSDRAIDDWVALQSPFTTAVLMDPVSGEVGRAETRTDGSVRLQLAPGQTVILRCSEGQLTAPPWPYRSVTGDAMGLPGPWKVEFITGGPVLPQSFESPKPVSWTEAPDPEAQRFAGTARYSTTFDAVAGTGPQLLDLGTLHGSARVTLNGERVATIFAPPYTVVLNNVKPTGNRLEIEATGVAANRVRDLDQRGVVWRIFEDINFVGIDYKPFDASRWPVRPQGLEGPVTIRAFSPSGGVRE